MPQWQEMKHDEISGLFPGVWPPDQGRTIAAWTRHYALGMAQAVRETIHCGYDSMTAVEIGVWSGVGLLELCRVAEFFGQELGMRIQVFGFDSTVGLPEVNGYMDHPELWHMGAFKMPDPEELRAKLPPYAKLIIGDVSETIPQFELELRKSRLGFVAFDVDLYTSTKKALQLLRFDPECYLPAVPAIFDELEHGPDPQRMVRRGCRGARIQRSQHTPQDRPQVLVRHQQILYLPSVRSPDPAG